MGLELAYPPFKLSPETSFPFLGYTVSSADRSGQWKGAGLDEVRVWIKDPAKRGESYKFCICFKQFEITRNWVHSIDGDLDDLSGKVLTSFRWEKVTGIPCEHFLPKRCDICSHWFMIKFILEAQDVTVTVNWYVSGWVSFLLYRGEFIPEIYLVDLLKNRI